ncbi:Bro-N domain-containing protein [Pseudaeromonas paramecii]|uniref:Bro-N domain-containing protein n=1 Tax=Pseudaeromonas paramecii TaxID=2138166 RepID=A0ABP8PWU7_9GAMM
MEYSQASAMTRHLDEDETCSAKLADQGQLRELIVINESGLYSAILRSRKPAAKRFKKWVTAEVLPSIRRTGLYQAPCTPQLANKLTADQQQSLKALVKARIEALPKDKQAKGEVVCWSAIQSTFGASYEELLPAQFAEALSLAARVPLEGELLGPEVVPSVSLLDINYTVARWIAESPEVGRGVRHTNDPSSLLVTAEMLYGMDSRSPTMALLGQLSAAGYCVESCRMEVMALRHHIEKLSTHLAMWQSATKNVNESGLRFRM